MQYADIINANKQTKAMKIKGNDYVDVAQRVKAFRIICPNGTIETELMFAENGKVMFKTNIYDENGIMLSTGHAYEDEVSSEINKTSYIEVAETSSIGRALGALGLGTITDETVPEIEGMAKLDILKLVNSTIKTTEIKKKEYAEVSERIKAFRMAYPNGKIETKLISIENGVCIFRAEVYDEEGKLLGSGTASEKEGSSFINKLNFVENCVPLDTQILTKEGWKFYYQLSIGEEVLSLNMNTNKVEYCKLKAVNVHENRSLIRLETSRFNAVCTPAHKWVAKTQDSPLVRKPTEELGNSWKIIQNVPQKVEGSVIGKKLGWLMCDCEIAITDSGMASTGYIKQSKYVAEIEELFGKGTLSKKYKEHWMDSYEWVIPAKEVREILGSFGMATYKDLPTAMAKADIEDVAGCYESMMLADGSGRNFASTYPELVEAVQIMCARLGIATTFITSRWMERSTRPLYTLGIKCTTGAWFSEIKVTNLPPHDVWCPTTENGTWFMRQGTFVSLTSNCETSAQGRALGMAGFGIDASIASAEEVRNAIKQQESKGKKSKDKPENEPKNSTTSDIPFLSVNADEAADVKIDAVLKDIPSASHVLSYGAEKGKTVAEVFEEGKITEDVLNAYRGMINAPGMPPYIKDDAKAVLEYSKSI